MLLVIHGFLDCLFQWCNMIMRRLLCWVSGRAGDWLITAAAADW